MRSLWEGRPDARISLLVRSPSQNEVRHVGERDTLNR